MNQARRAMHRGVTLRSVRSLAAAWLALGSFVFCAAAPGAEMPPGPTLIFRAHPSSEVKITGRATLGAWECATNDIIAAVEPGPALAELAASVMRRGDRAGVCAPTVPSLTTSRDATPYANISIPVTSLRCDKPGMRRDVMLALKHEDAPLIVFVLTALNDVTVLPRRGPELGRYRVTARGDLVLAGELRSIEIVAEVVQEAPRRFRIEARKALQMSDFGITPPSALFGAIRAEDRVTVAFDLVFEAVDR